MLPHTYPPDLSGGGEGSDESVCVQPQVKEVSDGSGDENMVGLPQAGSRLSSLD